MSLPHDTLDLYVRKLEMWVDPEAVFVELFALQQFSFWLDSSLTAGTTARYSFMGDCTGPLSNVVSYEVGSETLTVAAVPRAGRAEIHTGDDIFTYLRAQLARVRVRRLGELPCEFSGGYVGYFGYELKALITGDATHASPVPDAVFMLVDRFLCFDHEEQALYAACLRDNALFPDEWLNEVEYRVGGLAPSAPEGHTFDYGELTWSGERDCHADGASLELAWNREQETYLRDIEECLAEIRDGETYEVCLTNKIHLPRDVDPLAYYRILRRRNPAQYSAFLHLDDVSVACSSPERFLKVSTDGLVESRPIKGTRSRGATPEEEAAHFADLLTSEKDRAENLMIVDLVRNDLGRVSRVGSVHVPDLMGIETYATVLQMVSTIRSELRDDCDAIDCVKACFPGGSMTGAPKIRTMEIIDRLEGEARGVYSGSIGYLGFEGAADLNIVIRTAVFDQSDISIGVGGAIVVLSDPESEFMEIVVKGRALVAAYAEARWFQGVAEHDVAVPEPHPMTLAEPRAAGESHT